MGETRCDSLALVVCVLGSADARGWGALSLALPTVSIFSGLLNRAVEAAKRGDRRGRGVSEFLISAGRPAFAQVSPVGAEQVGRGVDAEESLWRIDQPHFEAARATGGTGCESLGPEDGSFAVFRADGRAIEKQIDARDEPGIETERDIAIRVGVAVGAGAVVEKDVDEGSGFGRSGCVGHAHFGRAIGDDGRSEDDIGGAHGDGVGAGLQPP